MSATILIVEDKQSEREALTRLLRMEEYNVIAAAGAKEAIEHISEPIALVISDLRMGSTSGVELLRFWKDRSRRTPFIMMTAHGDVNSAVEAMKLGAEDYLCKPVNPDELLMLVERCLDGRRKDEIIADLQQRLDQRLGFEKIVGQSKAMLGVFNSARRAAATDSTVLITGESGTGKELIAEAIHQNSPRKEKPFVVVNMAAVPEHLVESELFGHTKGSFTGATDSRIGCFEAAHQGTIFIDEIGDFRLQSQAKLLRVLENRTVTPVGSNENRAVDVRVVAATSRNLEKLVKEDEFREDLYYRLNVINLHLPPLRQRPDDVPLLIDYFLKRFCDREGREKLRLEPQLRHFLEAHAWPGNVRQLRNALESMVVLGAADTLTLDDVPSVLENDLETGGHVAIPAGTKLEDLEHEAVMQSLEQFDGNRTRAAEALGISVRTLQRKLKAWGANTQEDENKEA